MQAMTSSAEATHDAEVPGVPDSDKASANPLWMKHDETHVVVFPIVLTIFFCK
jgi:hypothetical protein